MQKRNGSHEIYGTPCTITLFWDQSRGHIGIVARGLSMALANAEERRPWQAGIGKSKKNKDKIRD
jgi:hypothetical protein